MNLRSMLIPVTLTAATVLLILVGLFFPLERQPLLGPIERSMESSQHVIFLIDTQTDREAAATYFDQQDYLLLPVNRSKPTDEEFHGVKFDFQRESSIHEWHEWIVIITFADGRQETLGLLFDSLQHDPSIQHRQSLTLHNNPRAGLLYDERKGQMYYAVSKASPHLPNLISTTHLYDFDLKGYYALPVTSPSRYGEQIIAKGMEIDFYLLREDRSKGCKVWYVLVSFGDGVFMHLLCIGS